MSNVEELYSHAARCDRLAEAFSDPVVAEKLRRLAQDHREMAEEQLRSGVTTGGAVKSYRL
jgi:hypothetical protein